MLVLISCNNDVNICTGIKSRAYHTKTNCIGLTRCSGAIIKVSKEDAEKKYFRHACHFCK